MPTNDTKDPCDENDDPTPREDRTNDADEVHETITMLAGVLSPR